MWKGFFLTTVLFTLLQGCDVRKKDKQAGTVVGPVIKDSTTVQLIDSVYDFGQIKEGETVAWSYRFKNTGNHPLVVTNVAASCGCTVADKPEAPVKPGETGFIRVKFNSDKKPGQAHKTVTVSSNANPPFGELLMKGEVIGKQ